MLLLLAGGDHSVESSHQLSDGRSSSRNHTEKKVTVREGRW